MLKQDDEEVHQEVAAFQGVVAHQEQSHQLDHLVHQEQFNLPERHQPIERFNQPEPLVELLLQEVLFLLQDHIQ